MQNKSEKFFILFWVYTSSHDIFKIEVVPLQFNLLPMDLVFLSFLLPTFFFSFFFFPFSRILVLLIVPLRHHKFYGDFNFLSHSRNSKGRVLGKWKERAKRKKKRPLLSPKPITSSTFIYIVGPLHMES